MLEVGYQRASGVRAAEPRHHADDVGAPGGATTARVGGGKWSIVSSGEDVAMTEVPAVDLEALPKLAAGDLRLLWVNDWYDGPLEAVVEHAGARKLMVLHPDDEVDVEHTMRWVLFDLSPAQWHEEEEWHELFEAHVGHHWCFHHASPPEEPSEERDPEQFYAPYAKRPQRALEPGTAAAWVDEMPTG